MRWLAARRIDGRLAQGRDIPAYYSVDAIPQFVVAVDSL